MADEILRHDENTIRVLGGITDDANQFIRMLRIDPVTGRLLVSGTGGGGGFTVLQPTETPNGVRTVFTLSTATGQPTFVISDNAMMQATSKAGTVNWTWNGGTLQVTMTIPPQDDLVGIQ